MTIKPLGNRVVIKPEEKKEQTVSGIILMESDEKVEKGSVVAVGPDASLKVGDSVLIPRYGYDEVKIEEEVLFVMAEEHILATFE